MTGICERIDIFSVATLMILETFIGNVKLAALFSGGKDSTYAIYLMEQMGHEVSHLITIVPKDPYAWLFHTLNLEIIPLHAASMEKELVSVPSSGEEKDDLDALRKALKGVNVDGVITGAIASDYQWDRINGVCQEMGLRCFSPLWRRDQEMLLRDMVAAGVVAVIVGTFAEGLDSRWLGRQIDNATVDELVQIGTKKGINVAGEGGEYETLVISSPLHRKEIVIVDSQVTQDQNSSRLQVAQARLA